MFNILLSPPSAKDVEQERERVGIHALTAEGALPRGGSTALTTMWNTLAQCSSWKVRVLSGEDKHGDRL